MDRERVIVYIDENTDDGMIWEELNQKGQMQVSVYDEEYEDWVEYVYSIVVKSLQEYLAEHDKQLVDKIKRHFDNNFYFDISGQMCVSMRELDEFLEQLKGENK